MFKKYLGSLNRSQRRILLVILVWVIGTFMLILGYVLMVLILSGTIKV